MLFYGISLIMKEKSNASALTQEQTQLHTVPATLVSAPRCARLCSQRRLCLLPRALTVGIGVGRSTVAHFARKVRGTNIAAAKHGMKIQQSYAPERRHVRYVFVALIEAKHCSSLCLQSEGDKYWVAKHGMKIQQSNSPERWTCSLHVRAPHFASKVSYSAGAATDDCASTNLHCKGAGVQNQEKSLCGFEPNDMAVAPLPLKGAHIPG